MQPKWTVEGPFFGYMCTLRVLQMDEVTEKCSHKTHTGTHTQLCLKAFHRVCARVLFQPWQIKPSPI